MRIAVLFDLENPEMGGSYAFNKMIFDEIQSMKHSSSHEFITLYSRNNTTGLSPDVFLPTRFEYRYAFLKTLIIQFLSLKFLRNGFDLGKCRAGFLNDVFLKCNISAVWAVQPLGVPVNRPYVTTSWDIAHKITPYLPDFSIDGNQIEKRDKVAKAVFSRAYKIVVGTNRGKDELEKVYGVNPERLLINPLPTKAVFNGINSSRIKGRVIYPANFWPHKNHLILIKAIKKLVDEGDSHIKLILTGSDTGSFKKIKSLVSTLSLQDYVSFLGFISSSELQDIYSSSSLLVFPSLIGPDNLPPLEALANGCKITVSDIPGAREQFGKFSTYFDPYDVNSVADSIKKALSSEQSSFRAEELETFIASKNPQKYVESVIKEIEKLSNLVESE